jgi:hypothetical protein
VWAVKSRPTLICQTLGGVGIGICAYPFLIDMTTITEWVTNFQETVIVAAIEALDDTAEDLKSSFQDITERWEHRVRFDVDWNESKSYYETTIRPAGENKKIFGYVDKGTKPHMINAHNPAYPLKFQTGYDARTKPIGQYNVGTGQAYGAWVTALAVYHPGTDARDFSQDLIDKLQPTLGQRVNQYIEKSL